MAGGPASASWRVPSRRRGHRGYARWSQTYDNPGNPLIQIGQPVVWSIFEAVPPGAALDAACGTGRHARRLVELGHHVVGVDASPAMLEKARATLPQAAFRDGDLSAPPLESASVDLVVCALALEHVADLGGSIAELSRVLRPGGRMVLSVLHPAAAALGRAAYFQDAAGGAGVVRGYGHLHGDYLKAFTSPSWRSDRALSHASGPPKRLCRGQRHSSYPTPPRPRMSACQAPSSGNSFAADPAGSRPARSQVRPADCPEKTHRTTGVVPERHRAILGKKRRQRPDSLRQDTRTLDDLIAMPVAWAVAYRLSIRRDADGQP